jgi:CheY-like chemotaxis protein/HPt (histidine-containing phosphotransfer) domain-containing protein
VPVHYDFNTFIENIDSMLRFLIRSKNIDFVIRKEGEMPRCLYGDDNRLRQVLINILNNAVKFTDEGSVGLTISVIDTSINFTIRDTGIGIKEKDIPMLFDAFTQVDMRKNRSQEGTGLGLSITKSFIELMGGIITVESVYGQGTVFHVSIPKTLGDETLIHSTGNNEQIIYAPDAKILVVDDNAINLNVARGLLQLHNISAETATSGRQAIEMIQNNHYDIVFMDHMMPEIDGVETTKILRAAGIDLPIIALTANAITGVKEEFLSNGMNDLLTKPINKALLNQVLEHWLPAEKIIKAAYNEFMTEEALVADENETLGDLKKSPKNFWRKIEQIPGLSVQIGLERISGQRDVYEKSLELTIKEIEKCDKSLNNFLTINDLRNFSIAVHGMKATLANIGAMELSAQAYKLEAAANQVDTSFCVLNLPSFLEGLRNLNSSLVEAFTEIKLNHGPMEISSVVPTVLPTILEKLALAFNEMDFLAIDKGIENLNALNPDGALKEEIEKIKFAVLMMDYEGALEIMRNLETPGGSLK